MNNKDLKNLTFEESLSALKNYESDNIPLFKQLLINIFNHIGKQKSELKSRYINKNDKNTVLNNTTTNNLTFKISDNLDFQNLDYVDFQKLNTGNIVIESTNGVNLNDSSNNTLTISSAFTGARLIKRSNNNFVLIGDYA